MKLSIREVPSSSTVFKDRCYHLSTEINVPYQVANLFRLLLKLQKRNEWKHAEKIEFTLSDLFRLGVEIGLSREEVYTAIKVACRDVGFPYRYIPSDSYYFFRIEEFIDEQTKWNVEFLSLPKRGYIGECRYVFDVTLFCLPIIKTKCISEMYSNTYILMAERPYFTYVRFVIPSSIYMLLVRYGDTLCYLLFRSSTDTAVVLELQDEDIQTVLGLSNSRLVGRYLLHREELDAVIERLLGRKILTWRADQLLATLLLLEHMQRRKGCREITSEYEVSARVYDILTSTGG